MKCMCEQTRCPIDSLTRFTYRVLTQYLKALVAPPASASRFPQPHFPIGWPMRRVQTFARQTEKQKMRNFFL